MKCFVFASTFSLLEPSPKLKYRYYSCFVDSSKFFCLLFCSSFFVILLVALAQSLFPFVNSFRLGTRFFEYDNIEDTLKTFYLSFKLLEDRDSQCFP